MSVRMPSIRDVAAALRNVKRWLDSEVTSIDVRLQVYDSGAWVVRRGDSQYDQDHRGFWGCSSVERRSNCREVARDLIDQASEHAAENSAHAP